MGSYSDTMAAITIPRDLHREAKIRAAQENTTIGELVCRALKAYMKQQAEADARRAEIVAEVNRRNGLITGS